MLLGAYVGFLGAYYGHSGLGRLRCRDRRRHGHVARHGRALRLARPRPDRGRDRDHARRRGDHERAPAGRVRHDLPAPRRVPTDLDPAARPDPRASAATPLRAAADRLPRLRASSALLAWIFRSTNIGLNLRAAGEKPEALDAAGVSVVATRSWAVLATGALAGLGGAYLAIVGAGVLHAVPHPGPGLHGDRDRDAGARPAALGVARLVRCSGSPSRSRTRCSSPGSTSRPTSSTCCPFAAIIVALMLFARRSYLPPALALPYVRGAR